ncbi:reverse transcriptase domain-containing protein [Tanacetum coccineum]
MGNVLIPKNKVKGVITRGGKMTSEATPSKEINETGINKNEPPRFEQDGQEKPHDVGVKNKSSTLVQMPKYAKYLRSLLMNKSRLEEACTVTMMKGASISLMPYTMYEKLGLGEPKPTRMSLKLADRSIQYRRGIVKNVLIKVDKFIFPIDFVILDMPEDSRIMIILGRPFLATTRAMIDPPTKDDEFHGIDDLDDTINIETHELLENDQLDLFLLKGLEKSINQSDLEGSNFVGDKFDNNYNVYLSIRRIDPVNTPYFEAQETEGTDRVKNKHLCLASINEIGEKKPELKYLPSHLEYAYLHGNKFFPIIIPSKRSKEEKFLLLQVWEKRKRGEDLAAYHLSRLENPHMEILTEREIADEFPNMHIMLLKSKFNDNEPWYVDFVNYIVRKVVPPNWTFEKRKRFFSQVKTYFWEEPYEFKLPTSGHHSASVTPNKVYQSKFYRPSIFKDANEYIRRFFDVWRLDFMGPFPESRGNKYILVDVDYESKWVEAQALPTNDARVVVKFLRSLFARFGVPKALISDRGTHFCNSQLEKALQKYGKDQWGTILKIGQKNLTMLCGHLGLPTKHRQAELKDGAYKNTRIYKERTKKWHDSRLRGDKDFKVGDKVLLYNSRLKMYPEKLKSKWSGPNIVKKVYPYGAVEIIERNKFNFKVNGQRLKKYYEGNIDEEDHEVIAFANGVT